MNECIFCNPNELTESSTAEEGKLFKMVLDPFPVSFGHILVVPRRHAERIDELNDEEIVRLKEKIKDAKEFAGKTDSVRDAYFEPLKHGNERSESMIKEVIGKDRTPDGFNVGFNEGDAAGQTVDHLHIHVIPRYEGDVKDPEGGVRNVIPERASYRGDEE